ncbi:MAPEG family protein [Pseudoprimorskyibacter insulae]|uniref:MAPEG family protein n=1 Tax=Pseudoprimorskyibacter insulae TaxID=1695997 RepID=A0A2R8AP15_9RHOB|nr:MAPEG family protein [Pseudoprimorskyibacter insulae]SPF77773.1 hypothetical protein PRI8871_00359 [Pseudoprimorskyibacter insulae]
MTFPIALSLYGLIALVIVGMSIMHTYATQGFAFGFSANRDARPETAFGLRITRSLQNQTESAAYAVPAMLAAYLAAPEHPGVAIALTVLVLGRALYVPLYWSGISFVRVPAFVMGTLSSLYLIYIAATA